MPTSKPLTSLAALLASLAFGAPASADPSVDLEAGGAHLTLCTPERESTFAAAISLGVGTPISRTFEATLRGHVTIGDGFVTALGPHLRQRMSSRVFLGYGPAIASVVGAGDREMRASGIGLAADLRAGIRLGDITLAIEALPIWVFASDSVSRGAQLDYALEVGVALGYQR
ncbi:MAG TPA: hypothetical protein VIV11_03180 [Kofleriaceae bacterium]